MNQIPSTYADVERRFPTALTGKAPNDQQKLDADKIRHQVVELAFMIETRVPAGRDKSIALTHLEDVLMRANRGIFNPAEATT